MRQYYPGARANSVYTIDYEGLWNRGYRGLIFDIDNTIVHHGADATPQAEELFRRLHSMGFQTLLLTNNDQPRVERFLKNIDSLYICDAGKPAVESYHRALALLQLPPEQAICIGDQVFTDILGANRAGLDSILVDFIRLPEERRIGKKRYLEKLILAFWRLSGRPGRR